MVDRKREGLYWGVVRNLSDWLGCSPGVDARDWQGYNVHYNFERGGKPDAGMVYLKAENYESARKFVDAYQCELERRADVENVVLDRVSLEIC